MSTILSVTLYTADELSVMEVPALEGHSTTLMSDLKTIQDQNYSIREQINRKIYDHCYQFRSDKNNPAW